MPAPESLVKWYGDKFKAIMKNKLATALEHIGILCEGRIVRSISGGSPSKPGSPPGRVTGAYSALMAHEVDIALLICRVGSFSEIAPYLELGTGSRCERGGSPYMIVPTRKKVLHWRSEAGKDVFAQWVMHPGIHPRPHIRPGVFGARMEIMAILQRTAQI